MGKGGQKPSNASSSRVTKLRKQGKDNALFCRFYLFKGKFVGCAQISVEGNHSTMEFFGQLFFDLFCVEINRGLAPNFFIIKAHFLSSFASDSTKKPIVKKSGKSGPDHIRIAKEQS